MPTKERIAKQKAKQNAGEGAMPPANEPVPANVTAPASDVPTPQVGYGSSLPPVPARDSFDSSVPREAPPVPLHLDATVKKGHEVYQFAVQTRRNFEGLTARVMGNVCKDSASPGVASGGCANTDLNNLLEAIVHELQIIGDIQKTWTVQG